MRFSGYPPFQAVGFPSQRPGEANGPPWRANRKLFEAVRPSSCDLVSEPSDGSKTSYQRARRGSAKVSYKGPPNEYTACILPHAKSGGNSGALHQKPPASAGALSDFRRSVWLRPRAAAGVAQYCKNCLLVNVCCLFPPAFPCG